MEDTVPRDILSQKNLYNIKPTTTTQVDKTLKTKKKLGFRVWDLEKPVSTKCILRWISRFGFMCFSQTIPSTGPKSLTSTALPCNLGCDFWWNMAVSAISLSQEVHICGTHIKGATHTKGTKDPKDILKTS